jgi:uncharacterized protein YdhG (YjbR/CyaY superfamily)
MTMKAPNNVDDYIAQAPVEVQPKLHQLREVIKAAAPEAQESIGYGMPCYKYKGRLVYFAHAKKHIGLYALRHTVLEKHADELGSWVTPKGTVQLPLSEELPTELVNRLVRAQAKYNDEASV